jgi:hypothetical protein
MDVTILKAFVARHDNSPINMERRGAQLGRRYSPVLFWLPEAPSSR